MSPDNLPAILRFSGVILCDKAHRQPGRVDTGLRTDPIPDPCTLMRLPGRDLHGTEQIVLTSRLAQVKLSAGPRPYALHRTLSGIVQWIAYESNRSIRMPIHLSALFTRRQEYRWCLWNVVLMSVFLSLSCSSS